MKRALLFILPLFVLPPMVAYAQQPSSGQASPEDFGLPPGQTASPPPSSTLPPPTASAPAAATTTPAPAATPPPAGGAAPIPYPTGTAMTPEEEERKGSRARPMFKAQLGFQYSRLFGVPIIGGRGRFGIGAQTDTQAHYLVISSMIGETETGRRMWDLRFGYGGELRLVSILRVGLGAEIGYVFVRRASIDERMWALGVGAEAHVGIDALTWGPRDDHALYFEARIEGHIHFGNADMWGPTISAGLRF